MSMKKKYLIELYLKCSKYLYTADENLKANERFFKASFQDIEDDVFNKIMEEHGVTQFLDEMTSLIDSKFTEEDVQSLIDFFTSPLGRKLVDKSHLLKVKQIFNDIIKERENLLSRGDRE